ncbi:MAG: hypothetical protein ACRDGT_09850 [Candidatus Limnocylindria bacterium]
MRKPPTRQILAVTISSALGVALLGGATVAGLTTPAGRANTMAALPAPLQSAASHLGFGGAILDAALEYIGITREQYRTEAEAGKTLTEIAVENGRTRDGLLAAMIAAGQTELAERVERAVDEDPPLRDGFKHRAFFGDLTEAAVTYLGMTREELMTELQAGNTLAEVAVAQGLTRDGLIAAMTTAGNTAIDEAEAAGRITAEQAATAREQLDEKVTQVVDAERPLFPGRGRGPGGRFGFGWR